MTNHIVITRPGYELQVAGISDEVQRRIVDTRNPSAKEKAAGAGKHIFFSDAVQLDVSATDIREAARTDRFDQLMKLVPESVANYIIKYGLYRETNES